jgi:hypothetical protein
MSDPSTIPTAEAASTSPPTLAYFGPKDLTPLEWQSLADGVVMPLPPPPRRMLLAQVNFHLMIWSVFLFFTVPMTMLIVASGVPAALGLISSCRP